MNVCMFCVCLNEWMNVCMVCVCLEWMNECVYVCVCESEWERHRHTDRQTDRQKDLTENDRPQEWEESAGLGSGRDPHHLPDPQQWQVCALFQWPQRSSLRCQAWEAMGEAYHSSLRWLLLLWAGSNHCLPFHFWEWTFLKENCGLLPDRAFH